MDTSHAVQMLYLYKQQLLIYDISCLFLFILDKQTSDSYVSYQYHQ